MKEYKETHQTGSLSIEKIITGTGIMECDFGIQIAKDGRIWICINGETFLRFKPKR